MARLPWSQSHNRQHTKSSTDKTVAVTNDWFSRSAAEPSRMALKELVKEHSRHISDGSSNSTRTRSRAGTAASQQSKTTESVRDVSSEFSRPASPVNTREGSTRSNLEKSETSTKAFFASLKKTGSKLNLSTHSPSGNGVLSGLPRDSFSSNPTSPERSFHRHEDLRKVISSPFDFKHIAHSGQKSINISEESKLLIKAPSPAKDHNGSCLVGERAQDSIPAKSVNSTEQITSSPVRLNASMLPSTPPRPPPPPKDSPQLVLTPIDIRFSRSLDVYSCSSSENPSPLPKSPIKTLSSQPTLVSPAQITGPAAQLEGSYNTPVDDPSTGPNVIVNSFSTKPLPLLPMVVDTMSANEDEARTMTKLPLPALPKDVDHISEDSVLLRPDHAHQLSTGVLRHMSTFPSAKPVRLSVPHLKHIKEDNEELPRCHSTTTSFERAYTPDIHTQRKRISVGLKEIDTMNWEDAVDEAWDLDDEIDDTTVEANSPATPSISSLPLTSFQSIHEPSVVQASSTSSTPLMMAGPKFVSIEPAENPLPSPTAGLDQHKLQSMSSYIQSAGIAGLGIEAHDSIFSSTSPATRANNPMLSHHDRSVSTIRPTSGADSTLTKSSSQESIILSIASSILGSTHRSSNSSVSLSDFAHLAKYDEFSQTECAWRSPPTTHPSPLVPYDERKSMRPESTCLPIDASVPSTQPSNSPSAEDLTLLEAEPDDVPPMPNLLHKHTMSSSKIPVLERRISVTADDSSSSSRSRSSTLGSRPRLSARASYSLFPASRPTTPSVSGTSS